MNSLAENVTPKQLILPSPIRSAAREETIAHLLMLRRARPDHDAITDFSIRDGRGVTVAVVSTVVLDGLVWEGRLTATRHGRDTYASVSYFFTGDYFDPRHCDGCGRAMHPLQMMYAVNGGRVCRDCDPQSKVVSESNPIDTDWRGR